jgi:hypothetical protein
MSMTEHREPVVILHLDQVETLQHLLGTVEDWLLHCGGESLDDLAGFLTGLSWASHTTPQQLAANLISDLGDQTITLTTALRETALRETALRETALRETALRETALRGSGIVNGPAA